MILSESNALLNRANKSLTEIEQLYKNSFHEKAVREDIKIEIKNFLENCRSALDYAAFYIFSTICAKNFSEEQLEKKEREIDFPVKFHEKGFEGCMKRDFTGLQDSAPDIVRVFEQCQPFKNVQWMKDLNYLVNSNKHRKFSIQERQVTNHIHYFNAPGLIMSNVSFVNCEVPVSYNGVDINFQSPISHPLINLHATTTIDFLFKDMNNKHVIPTLQEIHKQVTLVIEKLEELL